MKKLLWLVLMGSLMIVSACEDRMINTTKITGLDSIFVADSVDSFFIATLDTIYITDTITIVDTFVVTDTVTVVDTFVVTDTFTVVDTVCFDDDHDDDD